MALEGGGSARPNAVVGEAGYRLLAEPSYWGWGEGKLH